MSNETPDLLSAFDALQESDKQAATREYVAIVKRHASPHDGDGERLRELMVTLGINRKTVEQDIQAWDRARELRQALERVGDYQKESDQAGKELMAADRRVKEAAKALDDAKVKNKGAAAKRQLARALHRDLETLEADHAYLFATDDS